MTVIHNHRLGILLVLVACACFAAMNVLTKFIANLGVDMYEMVFWRSLVTLVYVSCQAMILKQTFATCFPVSHLVRGSAGGLAMVCVFYTMSHLPLAIASTLSSTQVLFFVLLSVFFTTEKPSYFTWLAVSAGFVGVLFLVKPDLRSGLGLGLGVSELVLIGVGLLSALLSAIAMLKVRELGQLGEPAWRIVLYFSLVATAIGLVMTMIKGFHMMTWVSGGLLLVFGAFGTLGQICMTKAYQVGEKFTISVLSYMILVFTAIGGFVVFDEYLDMMSLIGMILIVLSGIAVKMPEKK